MESTNKNKQLKLTTLAVDTLTFILALLSENDIHSPYKPTAPSSDPVLSAVNLSISRHQNISSLVETLISKSRNPLTLDSLRTCEYVLIRAGRDLNGSLDVLTEGPGDDDVVFTTTLDNWISSAILEHKMCLFFLQGLQVVEEMRLHLHTLKKFTNANVAALEKISPLLEKHRLRACFLKHISVTCWKMWVLAPHYLSHFE